MDFSYTTIAQIVIVILIFLMFFGICLLAWSLGYHKGYVDFMSNIKTKTPNHRKSKPTNPRKHYTESETVRIVSKRTPRS